MTQHIAALLPKVVPSTESWKIRLLKEWPQIIGRLASRVTLHQICDRHLILVVSHPSLAQELLMLTEVLCEKINAIIGQKQINAIHFRTGTVRSAGKSAAPHAQKFAPPEPPPTLSAYEQSILSGVQSEELRSALETFLVACKQRQRVATR